MVVPCDSQLDQCVRHSEEPNGLDHDMLSQCSRFEWGGPWPRLVREANRARDHTLSTTLTRSFRTLRPVARSVAPNPAEVAPELTEEHPPRASTPPPRTAYTRLPFTPKQWLSYDPTKSSLTAKGV
ncbi:hypothetical protein Shyhy02_28230 [Streptomyces hygroscopicus subsp. hygroscopicus]|nr:hypothetical protein Shyhy02_28230 [Streptomyces hygroscopicus subsp. hygroscopicus]